MLIACKPDTVFSLIDPLFSLLRLVLRNIQLSDAGSYSCLVTEPGGQHAPQWINYTVVVSEEQFYDADLPESDNLYADYECDWGDDSQDAEPADGQRRAPFFARPDELRRMQAVPLGDPVTICCHIKGTRRAGRGGNDGHRWLIAVPGPFG